MDIFVLKAVVDDLQQQLPGATVSKVFQMTPDDLLLRLWRGKDLRLLLSTDGRLPRLHLTTSRFQNPPRPLRFAAFLRAHLKRLRLTGLRLQAFDRTVYFTWKESGEAGTTLTLVHELTGRQANVILLNQDGIALEALKHVHAHAADQRTILPGQPYHPLASPPQRLLLSALTLDHLLELHRQGMFDALHVRQLLIGVSPLLATELVHRSQGEPQACWKHLQHLRQQYEAGTLTLYLSTLSDGSRHLSVLPLTCQAAAVETFDSAHAAVARFYDPEVQDTQAETARHALHKTLRQRLQKLHKKAANLERDAHRLQGYLPYQRYGTLLVAQRLPRGAELATVIDYYQPDQPTITIPLDPRLSIQDNAQAYFKKYRKAQNGLAKVQSLLDQCQVDIHQVETLLQQVDQAADASTLQAITAQLATSSPTAANQRQATKRSGTALPYRTFVSRDGYTLYCGKSSQGNEALLRQVAAPNDIWLHAHHQAGSHVIIKTRPPQDVPHQTLLEAASLAAFYSKGQHAAAVEVIYTPVKYIRKFRGASPGQVQVTQYRTLEVTPHRPRSGNE